MAFIKTVAPSGGSTTIPEMTLVGGARGATANSISFTKAYSNIFVVTFAETSNTTFTSVNFPSGCTHTEVASATKDVVTNGRGVKCYDLHNVAKNTTLTTQWSTWSSVYAFTY